MNRIPAGSPLAIVRLMVVLVALSAGSATAQFTVDPAAKVTSPPVVTERQPSFAQHGNNMIAVWHGGFAYEVGWTYSLDRGRSWTPGGRINEDYLFGLHAICVDSSGVFYLAARVASFEDWKVGMWRGRFVGSTFAWERRPNVDTGASEGSGPDHLQLLCSTTGDLFLVYIQGFETLGVEGTVKFTRSTDGGDTWSAPISLSGTRSDHSRAALGPEGELYVVWQDLVTRQVLGRKSIDQGVSFGPVFTIGRVIDNFLNPSGRESPGRISRRFPIYPFFDGPLLLSMAVDRSATANRGRIYVTWSERAEGVAAPSTGTTSEVEPNDTPATATPVVIGQTFSGSMAGQEPSSYDCDWFTFEGTAGTTLHITGRNCGTLHGSPLLEGSFGLYCADDSVGVFSIHSNRIHCNLDYPALVYTLPATGRYWISMGCAINWSESYTIQLREMEIAPGSVARDHRDVVLVSSGDAGASWSSKVRVNDDVGYDNAMPAVTVDGSGTVHVAWYDRRDQPECSGVVHTRWAYSQDQGQSFASSARLSTEGVDHRAIEREKGVSSWVVGDYLSLETVGGEVHAMWTQAELPGPKDSYAADLWSAVIRSIPTSTLVAGFRAESDDDGVRLHWELRDASGVQGFRMHRAIDDADFHPIGAVVPPARGAGGYEALDRDVSPGKSYRYQLEVITNEGTVWQGPVEIALPGAHVLRWQGATPNPFSDTVVLELLVPHASYAELTVYDVAGHEIRRLSAGRLEGGVHSIRWDGRDQRGRLTPPGVYLIRAKIGNTSLSHRIVRLD